METCVAEIEEVNKEVLESKKILEALANDIVEIEGLVAPKLSGIVKSIRNSRMTVTMELNQALKIMKDVRSFFLESDYEKEMKRLERFVVLGERLKGLIQDGTMDAIVDVAIKLAVREEEENEKFER